MTLQRACSCVTMPALLMLIDCCSMASWMDTRSCKAASSRVLWPGQQCQGLHAAGMAGECMHTHPQSGFYSCKKAGLVVQPRQLLANIPAASYIPAGQGAAPTMLRDQAKAATACHPLTGSKSTNAKQQCLTLLLPGAACTIPSLPSKPHCCSTGVSFVATPRVCSVAS